ncbi:putative GDP-fucose protein O-fucosyltransferase [Helianthus annuus]|uniref:O-fucosyltransferase family protein n=1 Tax=Helianthus annuus TaxID=4232 RepID=A0A251UWJ3_HELAN|nr:O-fucosyltransferase 23 [Helianthus annuus]KAF5807657.1 putative GDP-fucose protein O-fucosyltransferase [Helianthus annuus]KAJ0571749.1 putative GDP-fucose protein O-fucosyltransferase [Helianthus annuus]KAJ0586125.1 putative GDP-fucose protein O-fucosyltransferase [Helianthus annuus]
MNSLVTKCLFLIVMALIIRSLLLPNSISVRVFEYGEFIPGNNVRRKFLEVPQIVWGLNNQKIAFARACLTARMLNRSLLMPSLSASLFYKEIDQLQPISFDKVFNFERFNSLCDGFVSVSRYSDVGNRSNLIEVQKGSGRRWTLERDLDQLKEFSKRDYDAYETIRVVGKNPFLWHDHWPVSDYAKVFECLVLVDEILKEANEVVSKIREFGSEITHDSLQQTPYVAIHMRIEKDWMIHCKKLEQRSNVSNICSSKEEITTRVANIPTLKPPTTLYLAVANELLEDNSILNGWKEGMHPIDKKRLGLTDLYKKHPYLIQAAIDYEVCLRANVFVGNSYSTFSSLLVLERTQKTLKTNMSHPCGNNVRWPSYAYNIEGESNAPQLWITNLSDSTLQAISYGSSSVSC